MVSQRGLSSVKFCKLTERKLSGTVWCHPSITEPNCKRSTSPAGSSLWYMCKSLLLNLGRKRVQSKWFKLCGQL